MKKKYMINPTFGLFFVDLRLSFHFISLFVCMIGPGSEHKSEQKFILLSDKKQKCKDIIFHVSFFLCLRHIPFATIKTDTAIDQVVLILEETLKTKICTASGDNFNFVVNISQRL